MWMTSWPALKDVVDGYEAAHIDVEYDGRTTAPDGTQNCPAPRGILQIAFNTFKPARPGTDDRDPSTPPS
jgi:hypothetical protein